MASQDSPARPTSMTFVDSNAASAYAGHLVFCTLDSGMRIVTPGSPHASVSNGPSRCQLDVKEATDHALYFAEQSTIHRLA
ncbi:MAG: hypothetical protein ACREN2_10110 [Candidatus Dormibacteria bacterium]